MAGLEIDDVGAGQGLDNGVEIAGEAEADAPIGSLEVGNAIDGIQRIEVVGPGGLDRDPAPGFPEQIADPLDRYQPTAADDANRSQTRSTSSNS